MKNEAAVNKSKETVGAGAPWGRMRVLQTVGGEGVSGTSKEVLRVC